MQTVFFKRPENFQVHIEAAGCYCEYEDKILFLKRHPDKPQGNTWTIPGGKLDPGETPHQGAAREVFEETGIFINPDELEAIDSMYVRSAHNYIFHRFRKRFATLPIINLGLAEHTQARWVTISEALALPLIGGGREALESYRRFVGRLF
jgi:8-oxo-dGTP pyrophosphatase MutT (NUDIX family)